MTVVPKQIPVQPSDHLSRAKAKVRERRQFVNWVSQASFQEDSSCLHNSEGRREKEEMAFNGSNIYPVETVLN